MIYLDSAATTKPVSSIIKAIKPYIEADWYNPSVLYSKGRNVKEKIESVRSSVALEINAMSNEIYFTSGASESNNWVIRGFIDECKANNVFPVILTTRIEHKSILDCIDNMKIIGERCHFGFISVHNKDGCINITGLQQALEYCERYYGKNTKILVSVCMANSEIGTIQDLRIISGIVHRYNAILHTDATQAFGHIPIDVGALGVDLLTASAQKLGGLKGTGFLYKRRGIDIKPLIYGSQEKGQRGGTENVVGIIALEEAIKHINYEFETSTISLMRDYMIKELEGIFGCQVNGSRKYRLPNNINVTFPQAITGEALIYMLDMCNIYISSGSACNSHSSKPSSTLQAIGLNDDEISRTIRITLPDNITKRQIDNSIGEISKQIAVLTSI